MKFLRTMYEALRIWRLEGYDGRPTTLRHAWEISRAMHGWPVRAARRGNHR